MPSFKENLKEFLSNNIPGRIVSGDKEYLCRCPYCGDSKNLKSAHFYINLPDSEDIPVMYNCFKCHAKGILNRDVLNQLGVEVVDEDILVDLIQRHKKLKGNFIRGSKNNKSLYRFNTVNNFISINPNTERKLKYINDRLGLNLSYQDILDCKIVLNLLDLYNNKQNSRYLQYTRDQRVIQELNNSFVGFLGYNNAVLNMRNLDERNTYIKKRYVNYNLFSSDLISGTNKYYIIPTRIDTLNPIPIKICIAEGPFDVLSIFYNIYNGNRDNIIFGSVEGSAYLNLIKFLLADLKIINAEIHIYFDNDVSKKTITNILEQLQFLNLDVYFHWNRFMVNNKYEKDFGVSKNKIIDYSEHVIVRY